MTILIINCGSSSIKFQLYTMPGKNVLAKGMVERIGDQASSLTIENTDGKHTSKQAVEDHEQGMALILDSLIHGDAAVLEEISSIRAVGHRVVHGGEEFTGSVVITEEVIASIEKFADLAPLHNPPNLTGIRAARHKLPDALQVACFDTAFHTSIPEKAYTYALPYELYEKYRIRRYGFHGTSHLYVTRRAAELLGTTCDKLNIITCHLGNGCSVTAVQKGKSIDTSMGLTPLEGLVMGTRSGDFDPAILFYLNDHGYSPAELNTLCNKKSGLLGVSGISNDMRTLVEHAEKGDRRARLALDIFSYRVKKYIGAYTAVLGTIDAVVFTGGIGERAQAVRGQICSALPQLGIALDSGRNSTCFSKEAEIQAPGSRVKILVIPTDEEAIIAEDTYKLTQNGTK